VNISKKDLITIYIHQCPAHIIRIVWRIETLKSDAVQLGGKSGKPQIKQIMHYNVGSLNHNKH
jgi:hypothetical protein